MGLNIQTHRNKLNQIGLGLAVVVVFAGVLSGWFYYRWYTTGTLPPVAFPMVSAAQPGISIQPISSTQRDEYTVPATHPRYISIPKLGVSRARVMSVGVTAQNVLDVPKNINDAAWYDKSMTPGSGYGSVLIDGHSGGYGKDGIFSRLSSLQIGDKITIERGDGHTYTYAVVENQTMSLDEVNKTGMKMMMQSAEPDKEGLGLITCAGKYIPRIGQFNQRVTVRAVRVD